MTGRWVVIDVEDPEIDAIAIPDGVVDAIYEAAHVLPADVVWHRKAVIGRICQVLAWHRDREGWGRDEAAARVPRYGFDDERKGAEWARITGLALDAIYGTGVTDAGQ
jgi:hypothetical protein